MKRMLVDAGYGSSEEETELTPPPEPPQKRRKQLPSISSELIISAPVDDPSKHQGRARTQAYVDGQFAAHVYIPIKLGHASQRLRGTIIRLVKHLQVLVPEMHSFLTETDAEENILQSLHISLSRPIYLRAHQRDSLRLCVQSASRTQSKFALSFARISSFANDERTRVFISVEVGAGHAQLKHLTDCLTPFIKTLHQEPYYSAPRFHFSVAWALLRPGQSLPETIGETVDEGQDMARPTFPAIPDLPPTLLEDLNSEFGHEIRESGSLMAEVIQMRIGKVVSTFKL
ncbi:poly(U)-specific 3'-to-5' RNA exonuclease [Tulasnella sp. 427]|nr:poly(U)-specific 3'-to-5' RNA exonuclease [Tulasnella sp. 427]